MQLTHEEEKMLSGEMGHAKQKSMEILVALGKIFNADKMLDVTSVQVAGVSYMNLGDAGLEYLESLAKDGRIANGVIATLNPSGMDMLKWREMKIPEDFAKKQEMVINAYKRMGIKASCSCVPYFDCNVPSNGQHIAWSESSAVAYANSVLGARTNREGGPSSLASALTGKTPNYGFHLDENRVPEITIKIENPEFVDTPMKYGALGHAISKKIKNAVFYVEGLNGTDAIKAKSICASTATFGGTALFYIENFSANWEKYEKPDECISITKKDIMDSIDFLNDGCEPDFVAIGCPHCIKDEISEIASLLNGKKVNKEIWIFMQRSVYESMKRESDCMDVIEKSGAKIICDTCMAVSPLMGRFKCMATNSAKAVYYARSTNKFNTRFCSLNECIKHALA